MPCAAPVWDGLGPADPVRILSVGRVVAKKGFGDLIQALAALPQDLHWRFAHVGRRGNAQQPESRRRKRASPTIGWLASAPRRSPTSSRSCGGLFRPATSKEAKSGDRDGLPNVIMEAASQGLAIVATDFAGIPEFIRKDVEGQLVPPGDWEALSNALNLLARDPERRETSGMPLPRACGETSPWKAGSMCWKRVSAG